MESLIEEWCDLEISLTCHESYLRRRSPPGESTDGYTSLTVQTCQRFGHHHHPFTDWLQKQSRGHGVARIQILAEGFSGIYLTAGNWRKLISIRYL